jgi:hypothetical protein
MFYHTRKVFQLREENGESNVRSRRVGGRQESSISLDIANIRENLKESRVITEQGGIIIITPAVLPIWPGSTVYSRSGNSVTLQPKRVNA